MPFNTIIICTNLFPKRFSGMAIFPFIILRNKEDIDDKIFINHEKIHLRQQLELLVLPFYLWYGIEFIIRLLITRNKQKAYLNLSFEKEAYQNEYNLHYLKSRKYYSFFTYLKKTDKHI
ncbi:hypothetical protein [Myroides injenensis]|uniref:hypothetical protein n=1 Tax=Myroides injenensis TaxID=1183151 RepID=UPI00028903FA|nr:hypothetical protein [Myroides injenensis]